MQKKFITTIAAVALGIVMIGATAFAGGNTAAGYEALKDSLKKVHDVKSGTANVNLKVTDNGEVLMEAKGELKEAHDEQQSSGKIDISASGISKTIEFWGSKGTHVLKASDEDTYKVIEKEKAKSMTRRHNVKHSDEDSAKLGEVVLDALVGDLKNKITVNEMGDGSKAFSMDLKGNDIPDSIKLMMTLGIKNHTENENIENQEGCEFFKDFNSLQMPKLTSDINIEEISITGKVDNNDQPEELNVLVSFSGKDENGKAHNISITADVKISGINNTTPDKIDLTGKKVEIIDREN